MGDMVSEMELLGYKQWYGISVDKSGHVSTIQLREIIFVVHMKNFLP